MDNKSKKMYVFYQCRYYNYVFGHLNNFPIPTSQTKDKNKKKEFKARIIQMIDSIKREEWPLKERLTITVGVNGREKYIKRVDLDNLLKYLMDILKGRVFVDDKQIFSIMVEKSIRNQSGFLIGIRKLKDNEINLCIPPLYSENPNDHISDGQTTLWRATEILNQVKIK